MYILCTDVYVSVQTDEEIFTNLVQEKEQLPSEVLLDRSNFPISKKRPC